MKAKSSKARNFVDSVAQILDIFPARNKIKLVKFTSPRSDLDNLANDWFNVGNDLSTVMQNLNVNIEKPHKI